ncbi:MAG: hypothetical protein JWM09_1292 [Francisellaceae bacterium]|nr:hypothetical protein [Francisellaceae bacterium]
MEPDLNNELNINPNPGNPVWTRLARIPVLGYLFNHLHRAPDRMIDIGEQNVQGLAAARPDDLEGRRDELRQLHQIQMMWDDMVQVQNHHLPRAARDFLVLPLHELHLRIGQPGEPGLVEISQPRAEASEVKFKAFTEAEINLIENSPTITDEEKEGCECPFSYKIMRYPALSLDDNMVYDKESVLEAIKHNREARGMNGLPLKVENLHPIGPLFQKIHKLLDKAKTALKTEETALEAQIVNQSPRI